MCSALLTAWSLSINLPLVGSNHEKDSILLLCLHWCDQEAFCAGFAVLELEVSGDTKTELMQTQGIPKLYYIAAFNVQGYIKLIETQYEFAVTVKSVHLILFWLTA